MLNRSRTLLGLVVALAAAHLANAATITIARDRTPVKDGTKTVAYLSKGQTLAVTQTQGDWYGVRVKVGDKVLAGWVHKSCVKADGSSTATKATDPLEEEARKIFEKLKAKALKLADEGKFDEALAVLDTFPPKYWKTKWGTEIRKLGLEIEKRRHGTFAKVEEEIWQLVQGGKLDEALARVKAAKDQGLGTNDPRLEASEAYLALAKHAADQPEAALSSSYFISDVYAKDAQYHNELARLANPAQKPEDRLKKADELLAQFRWSPNVRLYKARLHYRCNQLDPCLAAYEEARRLDLGRGLVWLEATLEQARVLTKAKRYADAVALLERSLERKADDFIALAALGGAHLAADDKDKAIEAWEKSLQLNPVQPRLARQLAEARGETVEDKRPDKRELTKLVAEVQESCVVIRAGMGMGSGFVVRADGLISTNFHVIAPGGRLTVGVKRQGKDKPDLIPDVQIVLADPVRDIALLKIDGRAHRLKPLRLGSAQNVVAAEEVFAIGNPGGLEYSITKGIVSNRNRAFPNGNHYIQTDAGVNPGNSGGPLFNMRGEVIGMVTLKSGTMERTGFALHIDHVVQILPACFPQSD